MIWFVILPFVGVALLVPYLQLRPELKKAKERLAGYQPQTVSLSFGEMTYVDKGTGPVILVAHGMSGGYDQGYETLRGKEESYRILAPSRFGYLGTAVPEDTRPKAQAAAYAELMDVLGFEQAYLLGTSAGGTIAIRFALDYPERTRGLILYSSASPLMEKPEKVSAFQSPPAFLCNDYAMWLLRPLFRPLMGMEADTIYSILPVSERSRGMRIDTNMVNPDMARNFEQYPIEEIQTPVLIVGAKDDKLADFKAMTRAFNRFKQATLTAFDDGGHMMLGHEAEVEAALDYFVSRSTP